MPHKYDHLIVRKPITVNELPDHALSQVIPYLALVGGLLVLLLRIVCFYRPVVLSRQSRTALDNTSNS